MLGKRGIRTRIAWAGILVACSWFQKDRKPGGAMGAVWSKREGGAAEHIRQVICRNVEREGASLGRREAGMRILIRRIGPNQCTTAMEGEYAAPSQSKRDEALGRMFSPGDKEVEQKQGKKRRMPARAEITIVPPVS